MYINSQIYKRISLTIVFIYIELNKNSATQIMNSRVLMFYGDLYGVRTRECKLERLMS